ncbi:MAG: electron transport complex subunit RsxC [Oscillospiraceae bacterium]
MSYKRLNGVSVPHSKNTTQSVPQRITTPKKVIIPMSMHIGAPCAPTVKVGDEVKVGQLIGSAAGFVTAPIHASVSGKVTAIDELVMGNGARTKTVIIASDGLQTVSEEVMPPAVTDLKSFADAIRSSGLVGLGGAGFPTSVKLLPKDPAAIDVLLINGAECEPFITSDLRTMLDDGEYIIKGINYVRKYIGMKRAVIGIEDNKPKAIAALKELAEKEEGIEIMTLPASYPQGGEKVLIYHTLGRVVPGGKLPSDVGVIVLNVTSTAFIAKFMETGMPLVEKCLTVDGTAVKNPQNIIAPIGTPFSDIFDFCGGFKDEPKKVLMGGPMMGIAIPSLDLPMLKNNNAVLAFKKDEAFLPPTTPCIRCGRCMEACPMNLMPVELERAYKAKDAVRLKELRIDLCMECGCCSFV